MKRYRAKEEAITDLAPVSLPLRSDNRPPAAVPASPETPSYGFGNPGDPPLQGDDYLLQYDENGYPELPACLDRRMPKLSEAA
jgi:hypothetical protein